MLQVAKGFKNIFVNKPVELNSKFPFQFMKTGETVRFCIFNSFCFVVGSVSTPSVFQYT